MFETWGIGWRIGREGYTGILIESLSLVAAV
jgi:hypothetical protein